MYLVKILIDQSEFIKSMVIKVERLFDLKNKIDKIDTTNILMPDEVFNIKGKVQELKMRIKQLKQDNKNLLEINKPLAFKYNNMPVRDEAIYETICANAKIRKDNEVLIQQYKNEITQYELKLNSGDNIELNTLKREFKYYHDSLIKDINNIGD